MLDPLEVGRVIDAGSGLLLAALGAVVATLRPRRLVNALFAGFALLLGLGYLLLNLPQVGETTRDTTVWFLVGWGLVTPGALCLLGFALLFPRPVERAEAARVAVVVAAGVVLTFLYAPSSPILAVAVGRPLVAMSFLTTIFVLGVRYGSLQTDDERRAATWLALCLAPLPTLDYGALWGAAAMGQVSWPSAAILVAFAAAAAVWLLNARRAAAPIPRRLAIATCWLLLGLPLVSHAITLGVGSLRSLDVGMMGLARTAPVVVVGYGILRARFFDFDLRLKATLQQAAVAAFFVGAYAVGSAAADVAVGPGVGPVVGVGAVGLVLLAQGRVNAVASAVGNAVLPGVSASPAYLSERKRAVYARVLEQSAAMGRLHLPKERAMLVALREELGLTESDHAAIARELAARAPDAGAADADVGEGDVLLGRYRVERLLGEGAHGRVHLARDEQSGARVVVKTIRASSDGPRLRQEATALARVRHENVVALMGVEQEMGATVLVMEYLEGGSLAARLARGPVRGDEFVRIARDVLHGLDAIHAAHVVHRDVKPSNVLLDATGRAKIGDFGVAQLPGFETTVGPASGGGAVGTIRYMSPEQARGRRTTTRSDLYSVAATLFEAWTGAPYVRVDPQESAVEVQMRVAALRSFDATLDAPRPLREWFARALCPAPDGRPATAREMLASLEAALASGDEAEERSPDADDVAGAQPA